jgi:hypothetical protein
MYMTMEYNVFSRNMDRQLSQIPLHIGIRVEPGYNNIGLYDALPAASYFMWYQLVTVIHNITFVGYNDTYL